MERMDEECGIKRIREVSTVGRIGKGAPKEI